MFQVYRKIGRNYVKQFSNEGHRNLHYLLISLLPAARLTACLLQSVSYSVFYVASPSELSVAIRTTVSGAILFGRLNPER
jgi:hypothetical protein